MLEDIVTCLDECGKKEENGGRRVYYDVDPKCFTECMNKHSNKNRRRGRF